ncbi:MAG: PA0069 family radical SAM protein [Pseudomonadota bacterium]
MALRLTIGRQGGSGRGASSNPHPRFEQHRTEAWNDGWDGGSDSEGDRPLRTSITEEAPRKIITYNQSPDLGFDRSINAYRGCEHGCVYCFARPTHAYLGLSPGLDFETKLFAKPDAATLLRRELAAPSYRARTLALGTNTDPYQPIERRREITRDILKVLAETRHPVGIVTKSDMILRDLDILKTMAEEGLAKVGMSVTTLDPALARNMEPRAPTPAKRLAAITALRDAGVPVMALMAPIVPAINDHEIEDIAVAVAKAGASHLRFVLLRLPHEVKEIVGEWLEREFPDRAARVMSVMRAMRGGKDYDATFGTRQRGEGPFAEAIAARVSLAAKRHGLHHASIRLRSDLFVPPVAARPRKKAQLDLFA